ncbi:MAG: hypothetical protein ACKV0T_10650 [Planctomycetales bacterium]
MSLDSGSIPSKDLTLNFKRSLFFDGDLTRIESDGPEWFDRANDFRPHHHVGVWEGKTCRIFRGFEGFPIGEIYDFPFDQTEPSLFAIRMTFRTLSPLWTNFDLDKHELLPTAQLVDGRRCVALETPQAVLQTLVAANKQPTKYTYWICPAQEFAVVRATRTQAHLAQPLEEYLVTYSEDPQSGWYPSRWQHSVGTGADVEQVAEATVTQHQFNLPLAKETFEFKFPKDTYVRVSGTNELYIAQRGDAKRSVTREELLRGAAYEQLISTESGIAALPGAPPSRNFWRWISLAALVLLCTPTIALILWRRLTQRMAH